jgi:hypothetical protein
MGDNVLGNSSFDHYSYYSGQSRSLVCRQAYTSVRSFGLLSPAYRMDLDNVIMDTLPVVGRHW